MTINELVGQTNQNLILQSYDRPNVVNGMTNVLEYILKLGKNILVLTLCVMPTKFT